MFKLALRAPGAHSYWEPSKDGTVYTSGVPQEEAGKWVFMLSWVEGYTQRTTSQNFYSTLLEYIPWNTLRQRDC